MSRTWDYRLKEHRRKRRHGRQWAMAMSRRNTNEAPVGKVKLLTPQEQAILAELMASLRESDTEDERRLDLCSLSHSRSYSQISERRMNAAEGMV
jgi:hypothetical protein